jgi:hypothetical protein
MRAGVLVALIVAGLVVIVSPAAPAWACSCVWSPREQDRHADLTVTGTVTDVTVRDIALAVEWAEKGAAAPGETVRLRVGPGEASCGYDFRLAARYRVNSLEGRTGLCVGIKELPAAATPATTAAVVPTTAVAQPPPVAQRPDRTWWLVAGTSGVALIALVAVAVVLRRRRG